jgi:hypothetical protein
MRLPNFLCEASSRNDYRLNSVPNAKELKRTNFPGERKLYSRVRIAEDECEKLSKRNPPRLAKEGIQHGGLRLSDRSFPDRNPSEHGCFRAIGLRRGWQLRLGRAVTP